MLNFIPLIQHSLIYGVILGGSVCALFLLGAYFNPEVMFRGYPPDIKAKYGQISEKGQRHQKLLGIAVAIVMFGSLIAAIVQLPQVIGGEPGFMAAFMCATIMMLTLNIIDLVINDWLIFVILHPRFVVLPGTEGLAGYSDYGFHFQQFLKGAFGSLISGFVIAGMVTFISAVTA